MFFSHHVPIQHANKSIEKFPLLFPKETLEEKVESPKKSISSFLEDISKEEKLDSSSHHLFPIYEPLSSQYTRYPALDLSGKGKLPETHNFQSGSYKEWNIDGVSVG